MGFRFRKTIRLLPGVRLNISKSGLSTSVGRPGATINVGKRGVRGTVGLPGSGLSYSDMLVKRQQRGAKPITFASDMSGASGTAGRNLLIVTLIIGTGTIAVLSAAGLMTVRQSTPLPSDRAVMLAASTPDTVMVAQSEASATHVTSTVNCRANPNRLTRVITILAGNENLTVVEKQAGWSRVITANNHCWVSSRLVR